MIKFILTYLLICYSILLNAQIITLSGKVIGQKTLEPIPYAHVVIDGMGVGTVTNEYGEFRFALSNVFANSALKISCIGYESKYLLLSSTKNLTNLTFKLEESTSFLSEVVVAPVDQARLLVEQASRKINDNYPSSPNQLEGFLRTNMNKGDSIAYIYEGIILVEKESYAKRTDRGKIKLLRGRAVAPIYLKYSFYGGLHVPHFADFVHSRQPFISESQKDKFDYEILDSLKYEKDTIVRIGFNSIKKNAKGLLFINLKDYAFVKIIYEYKGEKNEYSLLDNFRGGNRLYRKYDVEYKKTNGLWFLNFVEYKSAMSFKNERDTLQWVDVFSTTKIRDSLEPIAYEDEFQYGDITLKNMGEYDPYFWNNYTIVLPDKDTEQLFSEYDPLKTDRQFQAQEEQSTKQKKILKQLSKIKASLGLFIQPGSIDNTLFNYTSAPLAISKTIASTNFLYYGLSIGYEYYFSPSFYIGLDSKGSFAGNRYSSWSFKTGYNQNFSAFGRPATANFMVNIGSYHYRYVVGEYNVANDLEINGKTFDSGDVQVSLESRRWAIEPTIRLSVELNHRLSLFAEGGWNLPFATTDGLHFKEKGQPFWKVKKTFLPLSNSDVVLSDGNMELEEIPLQTNLMINAGILIHFKY